jgi:hypothetical protein
MGLMDELIREIEAIPGLHDDEDEEGCEHLLPNTGDSEELVQQLLSKISTAPQFD